MTQRPHLLTTWGNLMLLTRCHPVPIQETNLPDSLTIPQPGKVLGNRTAVGIVVGLAVDEERTFLVGLTPAWFPSHDDAPSADTTAAARH